MKKKVKMLKQELNNVLRTKAKHGEKHLVAEIMTPEVASPRGPKEKRKSKKKVWKKVAR